MGLAARCVPRYGCGDENKRPLSILRARRAPDTMSAGAVLVYRDRIVPRSEAQFLRRLYIGFEQLVPHWIGCRLDAGLADLGVEPSILGRSGILGAVDRALFKQFGILPSRPDLRALEPRIIHAHFGRGGTLALPIARSLGIPLVVTFHGGDATKEKHYRRRLLPTIYQRRLEQLKREAAAIICVSDFIRDRLLARGFPAGKLEVIRYGVEPAPDEPGIPAAPEPYALFVGRFVEKKGIVHLLDAIRLLRARGQPLSLVLIGDGPLAETLKSAAADLADVRFIGWQSQEMVRGWMRHALALCVPSVVAREGDAEGLPNVVLEAMATATPVIGSRNAGIGEAIADNVTGLLVPPGEPAALAAALARLIDDPAARAAMAVAARRRAAEHFSASTQSRLLEATLLAIVRERRRLPAACHA
jgi:colanic acid/amylovoran biosynthesis glycosyltransferase